MPASQNPQEVKDAWGIMFEEVFFAVMTAMVHSEPYEAEYSGFSDSVRKLTTAQIRRISKYAAEYCVDHLKPSPAGVTQVRIARVKKKAIAYALKQLANEPNQ